MEIVWALKHSRFYTVANPNVHVITDHNPILEIVGKFLTEIITTRIIRLSEQVCNRSQTFFHTCECDSTIADLLSENPDVTAQALDVERNFNTVRRISRVMTRSMELGNKENVPRDLQMIAEEGNNCEKYKKLIEMVKS